MSCVLWWTRVTDNMCSGLSNHYKLNDQDRVVVDSRMKADSLTPDPHNSHLCIFHYNKYLFNWRGVGCVDPRCGVWKDKKTVGKALMKCPQWVLCTLRNIYPLPIDLPEGSLIHIRPCYKTFEKRYQDYMGFQPPCKRARTHQSSTQDMECDEVYVDTCEHPPSAINIQLFLSTIVTTQCIITTILTYNHTANSGY